MTELELKIQEWTNLGYNFTQQNEIVENVEYIHVVAYNHSGDIEYENWWNPSLNNFHFTK